MVLSVVGCANKQQTSSAATANSKDKELYLITDVGTIDDKSFNQGAYEGLKKYADENGMKANYLKPSEKSTAAYVKAIDEAVAAGAKVVVCPGFLFAEAVHDAQEKHKGVKFIIIDAVPTDKTSKKEKIAENTVAVLFKEDHAGFLAGYAAVKEGFTKLGFMGGIPVPAVKRFGFGWLAGANYAAKELGTNVTVKYNYLGDFGPKPEFKVKASSWYNDGTEIIFAAAGGAGASMMAAASELQNKWVVGVDIDQKDQSPTVITSAMKGLQVAVHKSVSDIYANKFQGGKALNLGTADDAVQISNDFSRFKKFTKADYDKVYGELKADKNGIASSIPTIDSVADAGDLKFDNLTIEFIK